MWPMTWAGPQPPSLFLLHYSCHKCVWQEVKLGRMLRKVTDWKRIYAVSIQRVRAGFTQQPGWAWTTRGVPGSLNVSNELLGV